MAINSYKKQILFIFVVSIVVLTVTAIKGIFDNFNGCGTEIYCFRRLITSSSYQYIFIPTLAILLSLIPLIFLKQAVYRAWRKFAVVALPIIILIIAVSPEYSGSGLGGPNLGLTRETAALTFSTIFIIISLVIIIIKSIKSRGKKQRQPEKKP